MVNQKTKEERNARRAEVKDFMDTIGPYSVPIKTLAEKYDVTVKVIYNDVDFWVKKIDFKKIDLEGKRLLMGIKKNLALVEAMKVNGNVSDKLKAIKLANETAEVYTKLMEQYGFKEKIADKLEHSGKIFDVKIMEVENANSKSELGDEQETERSLGSSSG